MIKISLTVKLNRTLWTPVVYHCLSSAVERSMALTISAYERVEISHAVIISFFPPNSFYSYSSRHSVCCTSWGCRGPRTQIISATGWGNSCLVRDISIRISLIWYFTVSYCIHDIEKSYSWKVQCRNIVSIVATINLMWGNSVSCHGSLWHRKWSADRLVWRMPNIFSH